MAPRGFTGLRLGDTAVWLLINQRDQFNPGSRFADDWGAHNTQLYARLKPGISPTAAREGLQATIRELASAHPAEFAADETLHPYSGLDGFRTPRDVAKLRTLGLLIGGLMLIVFVVACANLSNLVLSQAISRLREFSLRAALGASRWRILRQQIVESAVLTAAGTLGGLVAGHWCARFVGAQVALPRFVEFTLDWRVILAACAIAFVATLAIGIVPAWLISRRQLAAAMKDGGHQTSSGLSRARFRQVSIAAQVTGCCILLIVAGSTVRGLQRVLSDDLGFAFQHVAVLDPSLPRYGVTSAEARVFWDNVKASLATTPEIEVVALASHPPLADSANRSRYNAVPRLTVTHNLVEPSFFSLLRIPFVAGRTFVASDAPAGTAIISRRLALEMYGTLDVVGQGFPRAKPVPHHRRHRRRRAADQRGGNQRGRSLFPDRTGSLRAAGAAGGGAERPAPPAGAAPRGQPARARARAAAHLAAVSGLRRTRAGETDGEPDGRNDRTSGAGPGLLRHLRARLVRLYAPHA